MTNLHFPVCSIKNCGYPATARGWCSRHYQRWQHYGDPLKAKFERARDGQPLDWLLDKLANPQDACIDWPFATSGPSAEYAYGVVRYRGCSVKVTHLALRLSGCKRPRPPRNFALHSCDNTKCINPKHLRWGTQADNIHDAINRDRLDHRAIRRLAATPHGEGHYRAKLADDDIRAIRAASGTQREIALLFDLDQGYVSQIRSRKRWAHVLDSPGT